MATRVVWISRHPLSMENIEILRKAFGENIRIAQVTKTLAPSDIPAIVEYHGADAKYVVVLPPNLIQEFLKEGVEVYRFVVERIVTPDGGVEIRPVGLERIVEIKYVTERVV